MDQTLIIVDVQKDFYDPNGSLYVPSGEEVVEAISQILPNFTRVLFTVDWHPIHHVSFKESCKKNNKGIWPRHCVEYTEGAAIPNNLFYMAKNPSIIKKGTNMFHDEYSANFHNYKQDITNKDVVICGLAGDYCVLETIKTIMNLKPKTLKVYSPGIRSIDGGIKLSTFISENNITEYDN